MAPLAQDSLKCGIAVQSSPPCKKSNGSALPRDIAIPPPDREVDVPIHTCLSRSSPLHTQVINSCVRGRAGWKEEEILVFGFQRPRAISCRTCSLHRGITSVIWESLLGLQFLSHHPQHRNGHWTPRTASCWSSHAVNSHCDYVAPPPLKPQHVARCCS